MTAPLWTVHRHTDDQGVTTETPLTPSKLAKVAAGIAQYEAYGKYDRPLPEGAAAGSGLTTAEATDNIAAAVGRLNDAATRAGTPITTATITANTQVWEIARSLGTPQWS